MRIKTSLMLIAAGVLLLFHATAADTYKIDPAHTTLIFSVRHMGISNVRGHFDDFAGSIALDNGAIKEASGTIQVKSINTGLQMRDNNLRAAEFFDATNHPTITFKTRKVEQSGGQTVLIADFTIRGVTKELRLPVTLNGPIKDLRGITRIGLEARAKVNRKDFGMNYNAVLEFGGAAVGEDVTLEINAEAIKEQVKE
jgi:polyisoprenoid-binding protein YceI